jgi:hypothetical protein
MSLRPFLWIAIVLNLAACSEAPRSTQACPVENCAAEEFTNDGRLHLWERGLFLWLFTVLTFPFKLKG